MTNIITATTNAGVIVACPKCGAAVPLTDALAAPLVESVKRQAASDLRAALDTQKRALDEKARKDAAVMARAEVEAAERKTKTAEDRLATERANVSTAEVEAAQLRTKLADAQRDQADALRLKREIEDERRELALTVERQVAEQLGSIRQLAVKEADEATRLKLLEKDTLLETMQKKVEELNQKLTQGSQQTQGEVQELDLEARLRAAFPHDSVAEVAKGVNGADCSQVVTAPSGAACGLILYESKRTKSFSAGWLPKLREDGRKAQADTLVLVTQALPEEVQDTGFGNIDQVWVCSPSLVIPLAAALRATLLAVHNVRQVQAGMASTAEEVYAYVTGPQFKRRVEALVEAFTTMAEDLTAEQKAAQRQWAKRQTQIDRVLASTTGFFGDLQGIAGKALPVVAGMELGGGE